MKTRLRSFVVPGALALSLAVAATASAGNLLDDPGFELATDGTQTSNSAWVLDVNFPDGTGSAAQFQMAPWASNPGGTPGTGIWLKSFEGVQNPGDGLATATIRQDVPAMPGVEYELTAWYKRETGHLNASTRLGLEFFDGGATSLGAVTLELNDLHPGDGSWLPFSQTATAPPGAVTVRAFAEMIGGVDSGVNPQSAMFDDFSLMPDQSTPVEETSWGEIKRTFR